MRVGFFWQRSNIFITFAMTKYGELLRILEKDGLKKVRQKGSHIILRHPLKSYPLTIPYHPGKEVKMGLLKLILTQAKIERLK
jgi:predicted RNA binding protein YcfA (HicA-like mRNA interferase family)